MAESVIQAFPGYGIHEDFFNITDSNIDTLLDSEIRHGWLSGSSLPYASVWGVLIIVGEPPHGLCDQVIICTKGIATRHLEGNNWTTWKRTALS